MQHYMFYAVHHFTKEEYTEMCMTIQIPFCNKQKGMC